jgi:hypothetical protein
MIEPAMSHTIRPARVILLTVASFRGALICHFRVSLSEFLLPSSSGRHFVHTVPFLKAAVTWTSGYRKVGCCKRPSFQVWR